MRLLPFLLTSLWGVSQAQAKAVFAHFMVGNVPSFTVSDWESDIALAQSATIDAFALNIASGDSNNAASLANAFQAANNQGFKLFFSFDYAAQGPWDPNAVIALINQYGKDGAYWQQDGKPFVSTFEGPGQASQWNNIKAETGCFFIPDYSSLGPQGAANTGVPDGLFSWDAWPEGPNDMDTSQDEAYIAALNGKPYMMPVSPWYFTNLPSWDKNWLWRGDDLWFDRWQQVLQVQPDFVEIITWNDYGESHYIGPLHDDQFGLFSEGSAPYNYAQSMPHDGWRQFLPFFISQYKNGAASVSSEGLVSWYRLQPATACSTGGTTGNSGPNGQQTVAPYTIVQDSVFYSALLTSAATVTVSIGGDAQPGTWTSTPADGSGIYHGSVPFNGRTGEVVITVQRGAAVVAQLTGEAISTTCTQNIENWNAWVGSTGGSSTAASTTDNSTQATPTSVSTASSASTSSSDGPGSSPAPSSSQPTSTVEKEASNTGGQGTNSASEQGTGATCVSGTSTSDLNMSGLCSFACNFGYCPESVCTCTAYGAQLPEPAVTGAAGYPAVGLGCGYYGLCQFTCSHGYCPPGACSTDPAGGAGCV